MATVPGPGTAGAPRDRGDAGDRADEHGRDLPGEARRSGRLHLPPKGSDRLVTFIDWIALAVVAVVIGILGVAMWLLDRRL